MDDVPMQRAKDAKEHISYLTGATDRHPQGLSGKAKIIPRILSKNCWDTAPQSYSASEWGSAAGFGD